MTAHGADLCGRCQHPYASHHAGFSGKACAVCHCPRYTLPTAPPARRQAFHGIHTTSQASRGSWEVMSVREDADGVVLVELSVRPNYAGNQLALRSDEAAELAYWLLTAARDAAKQNGS